MTKIQFHVLVLCLLLLGGSLVESGKKKKKRDGRKDELSIVSKSDSAAAFKSLDANSKSQRVSELKVPDNAAAYSVKTAYDSRRSDDEDFGGSGFGSSPGRNPYYPANSYPDPGSADFGYDGSGTDTPSVAVASATATSQTRAPMTRCQLEVAEANKQRQAGTTGVFNPRCDQFGNYERLQCLGAKGYCWCVDERGNELSGTRRRAPDIPYCDGGGYHVERETRRPTTAREGPLLCHEPFQYRCPANSIWVDPRMDMNPMDRTTSHPPALYRPTTTAGNEIHRIIGGAIVGLLCAVLLVMFIVYRMRKKDAGSYALDEPTKKAPLMNPYIRANQQEFYA